MTRPGCCRLILMVKCGDLGAIGFRRMNRNFIPTIQRFLDVVRLKIRETLLSYAASKIREIPETNYESVYESVKSAEVDNSTQDSSISNDSYMENIRNERKEMITD